ncbi:FecR domain-containing protein [Pseudomonas fluorescens]|uniref:FecR domain-containing protein n=1 Tax=Pseudomonas fluorescens TaxID=294 RepID=UPI00177CC768|nr:FecR domain-containing protein [Pseudomonas fluorescens]MBD8195061.1 FecR domain-containing protein [Pseudomonas fluorescens]MBD8229987.1 FecR domain-containing protein [Pseudomonas fluorescens]MBD8787768.1 FecR domain-containing protein [Pseudomonas fluorescens]MBD8820199.1 FecR domain-containing protein [Pseudomonas fluorescens]
MPNDDPRLVDQAIQWMITLRFNPADDASTAAFDRWLHTSAEHQQVWQRVATMNDDFSQLPVQVGRHALRGARQRISRRDGLKLLGLVAGTAGLTWLGRDYTPLPAMLADYRTVTGKRRWVALNDGSHIQLNSASAFDTAFDQERRLVHLRQGEILVDTGGDSRPFWVQTRDGYLRALGTRFLVREDPQGTLLAVQQGTVALFAGRHDASARQLIQPGEQVLFDRHGTRPPRANGLDPWAWSDGVISARNMRLDDFLAELGRYRNGLLRCSEAVAGMRVSGTYQLDDTDQVLSLVAHSLKVDVTYRSRYWVTVSPRV